MQGETQSHDVCIVSPEFQGRRILWEVLKRHPEEVYVELTLQIVELIITLSVRRIRIHFFQVVFVEGTVIIDTLPDDKKFSVLNRNQGAATEWTAEFEFFVEAVSLRREG